MGSYSFHCQLYFDACSLSRVWLMDVVWPTSSFSVSSFPKSSICKHGPFWMYLLHLAFHLNAHRANIITLNEFKFTKTCQCFPNNFFRQWSTICFCTSGAESQEKKKKPNKQPYKGDKFETALRLHLEPQHTWHPHSWALILLFQNCIWQRNYHCINSHVLCNLCLEETSEVLCVNQRIRDG